MSVAYRFLEPLDVLFLRGNKLFGDPGSYGEALIPPWPSVAAGAIRSRMLADARVDLAAFARGEYDHPTLGTPDEPGSFTVTAFHLARRRADGAVEILLQPPADLVIGEGDADKPQVNRLTPIQPTAMLSSAPLPLLPVLAETTRSKPASGYWLTQDGWRDYLNGKTPQPTHLVKSGALWHIDPRVGVGLDAATGSVAEGRLFSVQAVALRPGLGFLAAVTGAAPPSEGTVRLGGDGRGASVQAVNAGLPEPDYAALAKARRCRLILTTPGIFPAGWRLPSMSAEGVFTLGGVTGRVVCAAVPRAEVVSGWDLARWQPKPAQRAAPTGSVYWLQDLDATPETLRKLVGTGLWGAGCEDTARRAEGFNRITLAHY
jgi:CRISPR-associated protein Cmr3